MPLTVFVMHRLTTPEGARPFFQDHDWMLIWVSAMLVAPWTALIAIVRQKEAVVRDQNLAFALERSELERQALDARLHLLQAQVAPHFLFNTLANVQALVDAGSPHASAVLRSLIAYLRAAVPAAPRVRRTTIERELQLVRPYLELMQMRMPDRLQYAMNVDPSALKVRCPPTTLLTLVENAVRHGIDPSEEGGRIDVDIARTRRTLCRSRHRHWRWTSSVGERSRDRAVDSARTAAADLRGRGAPARDSRTIPAAPSSKSRCRHKHE